MAPKLPKDVKLFIHEVGFKISQWKKLGEWAKIVKRNKEEKGKPSRGELLREFTDILPEPDKNSKATTVRDLIK